MNETVKLMIEIPKEDYDFMMDCCPDLTDLMAIYEQIKNGTILSECKAGDCVLSHEYLTDLRYELYEELCKEIHGKEECPCTNQTTSCLAQFRVCDANEAICRVIDRKIADLPSVYPMSDKPSGKWIEELKQELLENISEDTTDRWDTLTSCIALIDAKMESEDNR